LGPSTPVRYYLGVCSGPAGTSRLYYQLSIITGEKRWMDVIKLAANSIIESGIPEKKTLGYWNNVGQCCGNAGIAEWFLSLNEHYRDPKYIKFSKHMLNDILKRATIENNMMSWAQAENNNQPDLLQAQTGYMQGAAGIGIALLHMYDFENKKMGLIKLPYNPF
jgi:lantibiotic modifying enzyme